MSVFKAVKNFVRDDAGNAPIADVAILAVGATVLIAMLGVWSGTILPDIKDKVTTILGGGTAAK